MQLRHILEESPLETLEGIARFHRLRPPKEREELIQLLLRHLGDRDRLLGLLASLEPRQSELVVALAARGGEVIDQDLVEELYQGDPKRFRADLEILRAPGLAFLDGGKLRRFGWRLVVLPTPALRYVRVPVLMTGTLGAALASQSTPRLQQIARGMALSTESRERHYLIKRIRDRLRETAALSEYLEELPQEERAILDFLQESGGRVREPVVARRFHLSGFYRQHLNRLLRRPLVYSEYEREPGTRGAIQVLWIPVDLRPILAGDEPEPPAPPEHLRNRDDQVEGRPGRLSGDVSLILGTAVAGSLRVPKRGGLPRRMSRRLNSMLGLESESRGADFLQELLVAAGLLAESGGFWRPARAVEETLRSPAYLEQVLLAAWLRGAGNPDEPGQDLGPWHSSRDVRRWAVGALRPLPPDRDVSFRDLYDRSLRHHVAPPLGPGAARPGAQREDLDGTLGRFRSLVRILTADLVWLGVLEVGNPDSFPAIGPQGAGEPRPVPFLRLTGSGARLLGGEVSKPEVIPSAIRRTGERFILMPNLEVLAPPELDPAVFLRLCRFADLVRSDAMTALSIGPDSIRRGLDQGLESQELQDFLERHAQDGLPDTLRRLIEDCASRHGEIVLGNAGAYLTVRDPLLLTEILARPRYARRVLREVGDRLVLLRRGTDLEELLADLRREGYLPTRDKE